MNISSEQARARGKDKQIEGNTEWNKKKLTQFNFVIAVCYFKQFVTATIELTDLFQGKLFGEWQNYHLIR